MNFLIDIGNVLLNFDFEPALKTLIPKEVSDPQERMNRLIIKKDEFESGSISAEDYITWASDQLGFQGSKERFIDAWVSIFTRNEPMWQLCKKLHARGHQLILFSNTNSLHAKYFEEEHSPFPSFYAAIYSFQIGNIKPNPAIYQHAIERYKLKPEATIYVDDLAENIATGKEFGFHCWQYDSNEHEALEAWLKSFEL